MHNNSLSSWKNINTWRFWIAKNKCIYYYLINHKPYIGNIYLYAKDLYETKYQFLIKNCGDLGLKKFNDSKAFI